MDVDNDETMDVDSEIGVSGPTRQGTPVFQPPPTKSGRQRRFPRHFKDFCYDLSLVTDTSIIPSSLSQLFPFLVISLYDLSTTRLLSLTLSLTLRLWL